MKILFISDIHYGQNANYPKHGGESYTNSFGAGFDNFLPQVKDLSAAHDLVVNLGDIIQEVDVDEDVVKFTKIENLLSGDTSLIHVAGNHDLNLLSRAKLSELFHKPKLYYSFDEGGFHHVVLDGTRDSRDELHRIDSDQIRWLKNDLLSNSLPTLVYCHYPADNQDMSKNYYFRERPEKAFIKNKEELHSIFEESGNAVAYFNGHLHFFNQMNIKGIEYVTAPSFSENNGEGKPKAECLSVTAENNNLSVEVVNLS